MTLIKKKKTNETCERRRLAGSDSLLEKDVPESNSQESSSKAAEYLPCTERAQFKDVFFFRLGYLNYAKLNTENMVFKFEAEKWYSLDFLIDWQN